MIFICFRYISIVHSEGKSESSKARIARQGCERHFK